MTITTIDVATPLTMVLAETTGTETIRYLHGLGLVAQSDGTNTEYFLTDGLGSVRQMVGTSGSVLMAQTFDPYGNPYTSAGLEESTYGWAGEQRDGNGLVFLRARYYAPGMGRFFQMDPSRQEMNPFQYVGNSPVNHIDPSGLITKKEALLPAPDGVDYIFEELKSVYRVVVVRDYGYKSIVPGDWGSSTAYYTTEPGNCDTEWEEGNWTYAEILALKFAVVKMSSVMGLDRFHRAMGTTEVERWDLPVTASIRSNTFIPGKIILTDAAFEYKATGASNHVHDTQFGKVTIIHEFAHIWDWNTLFRLSHGLAREVGRATTCRGRTHFQCQTTVTDPAPYSYPAQSANEDWAESFAYYIEPTLFNTYRALVYAGFTSVSKSRVDYVRDQIKNL